MAQLGNFTPKEIDFFLSKMTLSQKKRNPKARFLFKKSASSIDYFVKSSSRNFGNGQISSSTIISNLSA